MRRMAWLTVVMALVAGGVAAIVVGCPVPPMTGCSLELACEADASPGTGGTGGKSPVNCGGGPNSENNVNACAVYVSAGATPTTDAGPPGTMGNPWGTLQEAIANVGAKAKVYACNKTPFSEPVTISAGIEVFGGFDCGNLEAWGLPVTPLTSANMSVLNGPPNMVALTIGTGASGTLVSGFAITGASPSMAGESSIAVIVDGVSTTFESSSITASAAVDGVPGDTPANDPTLDGANGVSGASACASGVTHPGPAGATNTCATGGSSTAGKGGDGGDPSGDPAGSGAAGNATPTPTPIGEDDGKAGSGEGQPSAPVCTPGDTGAPGAPGTPGGGAMGPGTISKNGYQGTSGQSGMAGQPGQGGGGGGGAKGAMSVSCPTGAALVPGASGGAGGTGGCGGKPAGGGGPGGSSIALLAFNADVTLTTTTLTAGQAGNGGTGGNGQPGGGGGGGGVEGMGVGSTPPASCQGGNGGAGGNGGPGGGGQGGHSLGIAFQGTTAPSGGTFMITATNKGLGGAGGPGNTSANMGQGANGMAADCWDFGKNAMCM
jgi:hypothetical protein